MNMGVPPDGKLPEFEKGLRIRRVKWYHTSRFVTRERLAGRNKTAVTHQFRCDPRLFVPVALAMVSGVLLLFLEGPTNRGFLLLLLLAPFFYLGAEILARKILVDSQGITVSKLLRTVRLSWSEIQSLDAVKSGSKLFLILLNLEGRLTLITNTIRPFRDLVTRIVESVPDEKVTADARELLSQCPTKTGPVIQAWIACLVLSGMVIGRLMGYG